MRSAFRITAQTHLLVLTGAGISAESGIPTFRGVDGLWENHPVERVASPQGFSDDPRLVWRFYSERRAKAVGCLPNPGHAALAKLEAMLGERFLLVSQNVDELHEKAGSQRLVKMHGSLFRTRCSVCALPAFRDEATYTDGALPRCNQCQGILRPDIVWFGESIPGEHMQAIRAFMTRAARSKNFHFLAAGTSGAVYPAAAFVQSASAVGARTWCVNLETPDNAQAFDEVIQGSCSSVLPDFAEAKD